MLSIRFNRTGKKNRATFRIVLQEKTQAPGRRHVEILGSYDPHSKEATLHGDRISYWIGEGAEVSDSVHNLLVREGVLNDEKKRVVKMPKPAVKEDAQEEKADGEASSESAEAGETTDETPKEDAEATEKADDAKDESTEEKAEEKTEEKKDEASLEPDQAGEAAPESSDADEKKKEEKSE